MDRFKEMQVFVRVAERRSFVLAAEDLLIPRSTVTNLVKRMEARLEVRLLERTTRQVNLTLDGEAYFRKCKRLLADLDDMDSSFSDVSPKGILRVNMQGTLAKHFVMPALNGFLMRYPDITMHLAEDDRLVDLVGEGIDCVLRAGELQNSSLIARRVALMEQVTVASPEYLARFGEPESLDALNNHIAVGYSLDASSKPTTLDFKIKGTYLDVNLSALTYVAGAELYTSACLAGLGLIQVPKYRVVKELQQGLLVSVLRHNPPPHMPVSVLYPQNRHLSPRTRVFVQWISEQFAIHAP